MRHWSNVHDYVVPVPDVDVTRLDTVIATPDAPVFVAAVSKAAFIDPNVVVIASDVPVP